MTAFNNIARLFRNMKLKKKLIILYLFVSAFAAFLLLFVLNAAIGRKLFAHEQASLGNTLSQSISRLEIYINDIANLSNIIYNNDDLLSTCNQDYGRDYFRMYTTYNNDILPDLYIYKCLIPEVTDIKLYTSCGIHPYKEAMDSISALEAAPWFQRKEEYAFPQWTVSEETDKKELIYLRKLPQNSIYPYENFLCLKTDYEYFFSGMESITQDDYGLIVADKDGRLLYQYSSLPDSGLPLRTGEPVTADTISEKLSSSYLFLTDSVESTGWIVYYYSPIHVIQNTVKQTVLTAFFMIAVCFTLLYLLTFFTVNSMLSPLAQLTGVISGISLKDIERHEIMSIPSRTDEIGILIQAFNRMLKRMCTLIDEAYVQKLKAKEYQFNALRAQINPHFLYNTLSLISARAIMADQNDISETVQLLALFYRTSLNSGHDITTVRNELENIRAYLSIQLTLSSQEFQVEYRLDNTLLDRPIPCLVLQPLVENAIEHGLKNCRRNDKRLIISLSEDTGFCRITITDNGLGIAEERITELFTRETDHVGIKNVNERLRLFFGEENGLTLNSSPGQGTEVVIRMPSLS